MRKSMIVVMLIMMLAVAMTPTRSEALVLYSNLVPNGSLTGDQSINGTTGAIFDDVLIDNTINNLTNENWALVTSVTVGILRDVGAAPATITGYYATTTTPGNPNDFPILDVPPNAFGSVAIPAYAGVSQGVEYYTITAASPFVIPLNLSDQPTFSEFAVGLRFSNQSTNAWAVAVPQTPDTNLDGAWDANLSDNTNSAYSLQFNGNPIYTTFALEVTGALVPEPASLGVTMFALASFCSHRRHH